MRLGVAKQPWTRRLTAAFLAFLPLPGVAAPARAESSCQLRGQPVMSKTASIYDAASGGQEIARFTGARAELNATSFPESASGRIGIGTSGFRIQGYVASRELPVYTTRSVPVYAGHVWIADGRRVNVLGSASGRLHVEKAVSFPLTGYFHGWAPCDAFSLTEKIPSGWSPPGSARGYVVKRDRVELFTERGGSVATVIEPSSAGPGVLMWSTGDSGGWVHVEHHSDVILDGWVKTQDVSALPPGETMDQLAPSRSVSGSPQLQVQGNTKVVRVPREVSIRSTASEAGLVIGAVEQGQEVLVLDVVAGWASVVPKTLTVSPVGATQFWVKAKDLEL